MAPPKISEQLLNLQPTIEISFEVFSMTEIKSPPPPPPVHSTIDQKSSTTVSGFTSNRETVELTLFN